MLAKKKSLSGSLAPLRASASSFLSIFCSSVWMADGVEARQILEGEHQRLDALGIVAVVLFERW